MTLEQATKELKKDAQLLKDGLNLQKRASAPDPVFTPPPYAYDYGALQTRLQRNEILSGMGLAGLLGGRNK